MKFFTTILAAAALTLSTVQASLDWTADSTLECAQENWATIKAKCDPLLSTASSMLTPELMEKLKDLLGDDGLLLANPTIDQLREAANIFPPSLFEIFAGKEIKACLATYVTKTPTPTESTTTSESATSTTESTTSTAEPTTSTTESATNATESATSTAESATSTAESTTTDATSTADSTTTATESTTTEETVDSTSSVETPVSSEPSSWVMSTTDEVITTSAFKCPPPAHVTIHVKAN
ncbi:hypothetical protein FBU59_000286 [Linderina macrospora]|uniref:Uncharacterized protein n=1 Tax=Linderina macrospora TaxID=4868 RepID=A0ACC1JHM6_9FUNG|nr:hypothetical protein FBU59_000286 [Linderina macrospora]